MPSRAREALTLVKALATRGERREAAVAIITRPRNLFQPYTTTAANRYPQELAVVAENLPAPERILSFGCASGDELVSLRTAFPDAVIDGIDINPLAVRAARRRTADDPRITVSRRGEAPVGAAYDVVLALAVFRHAALNDAPESCAGVIAFADFERTVTGLSDSLRPGGLLVLRHANFRFTDTEVAAGYDALSTGYLSAGEGGLPTPVYGPDDRLIGTEQRDDGIYRKR